MRSISSAETCWSYESVGFQYGSTLSVKSVVSLIIDRVRTGRVCLMYAVLRMQQWGRGSPAGLQPKHGWDGEVNGGVKWARAFVMFVIGNSWRC